MVHRADLEGSMPLTGSVAHVVAISSRPCQEQEALRRCLSGTRLLLIQFGEWLAWQSALDSGEATAFVSPTPRPRLYVLDVDAAVLAYAAQVVSTLRRLWGAPLPIVVIVADDVERSLSEDERFANVVWYCAGGSADVRAVRLQVLRDYWLKTVELPKLVAPNTPVEPSQVCGVGTLDGHREVVRDRGSVARPALWRSVDVSLEDGFEVATLV
jgi:hypothetical protein